MFEGLYGNIQKRTPSRLPKEKEKQTLKGLLELEEISSEEVIKTYIGELKMLLKLTSMIDLIEGIHRIQAVLNRIEEKFFGLELPLFHDFYYELSPLLLQKFWEKGKNPDPAESFETIILESIHIALEEEIYIWQEKIS